jgi:hypothetical protein
MDYRLFYDLDEYVFTVVNPRFHRDGRLAAFDFFCLIIRHSSRAKPMVVNALLARAGSKDLETAAAKLTGELFKRPWAKEKFRYLIKEWSFTLSLASAVMSALYPDQFVIYDPLVCEQLCGFHELANLSDFEALWKGYAAFKSRLEKVTPPGLSLRDKDRWLWGRSFHDQLRHDLGSR